jgi:hemerythrin-like domain-containing protein
MSDVVRALLDEHGNMKRMLDAFERQVKMFADARKPDYDILRGSLDYCVGFLDEYHHPREDFLFRRLKRRAPETAEDFGDLELEHGQLAARSNRVRRWINTVAQGTEVSRDEFIAQAQRFLDTYRDHLRREEEIFFPAIEEALVEKDWQTIKERFGRRSDPVFGEAAEKRFEALLDDILAWERG